MLRERRFPINEQVNAVTAGERRGDQQDGEVIVVIQAADAVFELGDSVRVLRRSDGGVRVMQ